MKGRYLELSKVEGTQVAKPGTVYKVVNLSLDEKAILELKDGYGLVTTKVNYLELKNKELTFKTKNSTYYFLEVEK